MNKPITAGEKMFLVGAVFWVSLTLVGWGFLCSPGYSHLMLGRP